MLSIFISVIQEIREGKSRKGKWCAKKHAVSQQHTQHTLGFPVLLSQVSRHLPRRPHARCLCTHLYLKPLTEEIRVVHPAGWHPPEVVNPLLSFPARPGCKQPIPPSIILLPYLRTRHGVRLANICYQCTSISSCKALG